MFISMAAPALWGSRPSPARNPDFWDALMLGLLHSAQTGGCGHRQGTVASPASQTDPPIIANSCILWNNFPPFLSTVGTEFGSSIYFCYCEDIIKPWLTYSVKNSYHFTLIQVSCESWYLLAAAVCDYTISNRISLAGVHSLPSRRVAGTICSTLPSLHVLTWCDN